MNAHAPITAAFSTDAPGWDRPVFERQIAMLGELAEAGLEAALTIRDQAVAAAADGAHDAPPASISGSPMRGRPRPCA